MIYELPSPSALSPDLVMSILSVSDGSLSLFMFSPLGESLPVSLQNKIQSYNAPFYLHLYSTFFIFSIFGFRFGQAIHHHSSAACHKQTLSVFIISIFDFLWVKPW